MTPEPGTPRRRLRRVFFQVHLWCGLLTGIYMVAISLSGSILVYRDELRAMFQPQPHVVEIAGERMTEEALIAAGESVFPEHEVFVYTDPEDPTHAITLGVNRGDVRRQMLFDPYTGESLGNAIPWGWRAVTWLLDFHGTLVAGETGETLNGLGAIALCLLALTGLYLWWPGVRRLARGLRFQWRGVAWRRRWFSVHGALGAWSLVFLLMWGATGIYLVFPEPFSTAADWIQPMDPESFEPRTVDHVLYWIAYVHFGRFGGQPTQFVWALFGLVPPVLFVTGTALWWLRRPRGDAP